MRGDRVVIITDATDSGARHLAQDLNDRAVLVTPRDLSRPGWTYRPDPGERRAMTTDGELGVGDIAVVVTRLGAVFETQLLHVTPIDRSYVAAEMTAFLRAWLDGLPIPVVDPPTTSSLSGTLWSSEQWSQQCASIGLSFAPLRRSIPAATSSSSEAVDGRRVHVAGRHVHRVGSVSDAEIDAARALADATRVHHIALTLSADRFVVTAVSTRADLDDPAIRGFYLRSLDDLSIGAGAFP